MLAKWKAMTVCYAHSEYSENDEEDDFEEMPVAIVGDLEQYQLSASVWVHRL